MTEEKAAPLVSAETPADRFRQEKAVPDTRPADALGRDVSLTYLIAAGILLILYEIIAWRMNFFQSGDFRYLGNPLHIWYLSYEQAASSLWKIILLFPASLSLAWFMSSRGYGIKAGSLYPRRSAPVVFSLAAAVVLVFIISSVLHQTEVTDDELTYDLQAKILLDGKLYITPPVEGSFANVFVLPGPKMTGKYNLGHPLVLAAGMLIGSPYVFPVVFGALLIVLMYSINMLLFRDRRQAFVSSLLLSVSPFFYFTGATRLSHTTTAFALTVFMFLFLKLREETRRGPGGLLLSLAAGLAAGLALNVRPLTAVGFLFPFLVLTLADLVRRKPGVALKYVVIGAGFLAVIAFSLWYNKEITGSYFRFPFGVYDAGEQPLGGRYNPVQPFANLAVNVVRMNAFLFGFPLSLLFLFVYVFRGNKSASDKLCYGIIGSLCFFYLSYYGQCVSDTGPVYYYELLVPLITLSTRGLLWLHDLIKTHIPRGKSTAANFLVVSLLLSAPTFWFERSLHLVGLTNAISEPYRVIQASGIHRALVFIQSWPNKGFVFGFRNNSPEFTDDVLLCRLRKGEDNLKVIARFPNRAAYLLRYNAADQRTELIPVSSEQLAAIQ